MPRYDARQILRNLEALRDNSPEAALPSPRLDGTPPPSPAPETPPSSGASTAPPPPALPENTAFEALNLSLLPSMRAHMRVDKIPEGSRLAFLKKALLRALRLVAGPQASYNYFALSAIETLAQRMDGLRAVIEAQSAALRAGLEEIRCASQAAQAREMAMREALTELQARVEEVGRSAQDMTNGVWKGIEERDARAEALRAGLAELQARVEEAGRSAQDMTDGVWKGIEERDARAAALRAGLAELQARVEEVGRSAQDMTNGVWKGIEERDAQARRQLEGLRELQTRVAGFDHRLHEFSAQAQALQQEMLLWRDRMAAAAAVAPAPAPSAPQAEPPAVQRPAPPAPGAEDSTAELHYLRFQRLFRGDEEQLRRRQRGYVTLIERHMRITEIHTAETVVEDSQTPGRMPGGAPGGSPDWPLRLLDLACGDGLFLELWKNRRGWETLGVDINGVMIRLARQRGAAAERADAFEFLAAQPEESWNVITAFQFIEHLEEAEIRRLLRLARRALRPGGLLLAETLNPHSYLAHKWFHLDLSHKRLIFPEALELMLDMEGFRLLERGDQSAPPDYERLRVEGDDAARENFRRLNQTLYSAQDYYALARLI